MSRSLKVRIDQTERTKLALKRNGFHSQRALAEATGFALATVGNFLRGRPVDVATFVELSEHLSLDWHSIADVSEGARPSSEAGQPHRTHAPQPCQDWGESTDVSTFYGRYAELATLTQWIEVDRCRFVVILGMGGVGKTTLSVKLAHQIQNQFDFVIWRSLRNAPPIDYILDHLIQFLTTQRQTQTTFDAKLLQLLAALRNHRCLIILDNAESILQSSDRNGRYQPGYEGYSQLFKAVSETSHNSCLLITSREAPQELTVSAGESLPVRSFQLKGLSIAEAQKLFPAKGVFTGQAAEWNILIEHYGGNPLALKIVASTIRDLFDGSITNFLSLLSQESWVVDDVRSLLAAQFRRLTPLEQEIMYWLAISQEPISWQHLQTDLVGNRLSGDILQAIAALDRRALLEKSGSGYTQSPVVMEFLIHDFVERIYQEISHQDLDLLKTHCLVQANAKDYIRDTQIRLILDVVSQKLQSSFGSQDLETCLRTMLATLRSQPPQITGYVGGNIFNLLRHLPIDLERYDFSHLRLWQANFQGLTLKDVNFAGCDIAKSVFTQTFSSIRAVAFSPADYSAESDNEQLLATGDTNGEIRLWQVPDYQHTLTLQGHTNWVCAVAFSPQGDLLASASADHTIKLWDLQTGQCLQTLEGHSSWVMSVEFSPVAVQQPSGIGHLLASSSADRTVKLWEIQTGQCLQTLPEHQHGVWSIAFSPKGTCLASASADRTIKVWDVRTGQCLKTLNGHTHGVWSIAFSPQGDTLASGSADQTIRIWDLQQGKCLKILEGHDNWVWSVAFSPQGDTLASGSADQTIRIWDLQRRICLKFLEGHDNWVWSVAFSPQGDTLASGSEDRTLRLWDLQQGQCLKTLQGYGHWIRSITFHPNGDTLMSGSTDQSLTLWSTRSGDYLGTLSQTTNSIWAVAFDPTGQVLASGHEDSQVRLWDVQHRQCFKTLAGHTNTVWSVAFSPRGDWLTSGSADQTIKIWEIDSGQLLQTFQGHNNWVCSVAFHPQGDRLASGSYDRTIKLWDVMTGQCLQTLSGHTSGVWSIAFSPQEDLLASSSMDKTIKLWNVKTGKCMKTLQGHENWVMSVAFNPDGDLLVSGSADHTVRIWDAKSGQCLHTLLGHRNEIWSVAFSPDGQQVASGGDDQTLKLWAVKTQKCLRTLTAPKPYAGMNIQGVTGLTDAQKATLKTLGASE